MILGSNSRSLTLGLCPVAPCPPRLDPAVRLSTLDVSHLDLMNEMWPYQGNKYSKRFLESLIHCFPSFYLLNSVYRLVSWTVSDPYGALGRRFTLPQHRGCGYNGVLNNLIAKRLHALGSPSYGHVAADNYPMQRLQERQGFHRQPSLCHFILHNAALHRPPTLTRSPAPGTPRLGLREAKGWGCGSLGISVIPSGPSNISQLQPHMESATPSSKGLALPHSPVLALQGLSYSSKPHNLPSLVDPIPPDPYTQHPCPTFPTLPHPNSSSRHNSNGSMIFHPIKLHAHQSPASALLFLPCFPWDSLLSVVHL
nr:uncharacterized protein LOC122172853 [Chrysemys picta bellii]